MKLYLKKKCPVCGNRAERVRRLLIDRVLCILSEPFIQLRRYRCFECDWEGLLKRK